MKILKSSLSLKEMIGEMDEDGSGTVDFEVSQGCIYRRHILENFRKGNETRQSVCCVIKQID